MALERNIYRALEDIVGLENLSEDLAILDNYSFFQIGAMAKNPSDRYSIRPEAILLPANTSQVQAIVKLCNRFKIKYRATSTGYGPMNAAGSEGVIVLDMRRMNRILDIDEKNMIVVVEPYVSFAQVQGEAMKRGLSCNVLGAGSNASFLASYTSMVGNNTQAISQGYSGRNLLGVEWVLPTGEVIRLGAPGSGCGWFSGDGPGPSMRGIMRGASGAVGALGIFTKCAGHLHPWQGPPEIKIEGKSPYYEAEIPPTFEYHVLEWPTWEQCADAQYKVGAAGIAFAFHKTGGPGSHGACVTGNNNEYFAKRQAGELSIPEISWAIITAAYTEEEHAYQVRVLHRILEDTGGKICPTGEDQSWKKRDFLTVVKACFIPRLAFRPTGTFTCDGMMGQESIDNCSLALKLDRNFRDKYASKGVIMDDGTFNNWGVVYEGSHIGLLEGGYEYSNLDQASIDGMKDMAREGTEVALKTPIGMGWVVMGEAAKMFGPYFYNVQNWMYKIKKTFDPNTASDPAGYISTE